jgi:aldehyde dehydrogenase (NAD+)
MGPVIGKVACERILGVIERAVSAGEGRLASGGKRLGGELAKGFFIPPTVFVDVKPGSLLAQDEIFGPVLSVIPFDTDEEAIAIANGTRYGLGAYLHTRNIDRARQAARRLDAGYISINGFSGMTPTAPFGGYKQSGYGRAGGRAGLDEYLQSKTVFVGGRQF